MPPFSSVRFTSHSYHAPKNVDFEFLYVNQPTVGPAYTFRSLRLPARRHVTCPINPIPPVLDTLYHQVHPDVHECCDRGRADDGRGGEIGDEFVPRAGGVRGRGNRGGGAVTHDSGRVSGFRRRGHTCCGHTAAQRFPGVYNGTVGPARVEQRDTTATGIVEAAKTTTAGLIAPFPTALHPNVRQGHPLAGGEYRGAPVARLYPRVLAQAALCPDASRVPDVLPGHISHHHWVRSP